MKKLLRLLGASILFLILLFGILYFAYNESLPEGTKGKEADALAQKMLDALNKEAYDEVEVLEWSFRNQHFYQWYKQEGKVYVSWGKNQVVLNLLDHSKSKGDNPELIRTALDFFNNDSFWLVAPYKVFDEGTERRLVSHEGKDALLITYTSGGSTPGDSYLWILDNNGLPTHYKMWVSIIPIGGLKASWDTLISTEAGLKLPTNHTLSLLSLEIPMGDVKAYNPNANAFADKILDAVKHDAYKNTRYLEWSFGGRRSYKWDKQEHIVDVLWDSIKVVLHPNEIAKSSVYLNNVLTKNKENLIKRAWNLFNNDSFWLVAPHKLFEPGIIRSITSVDGEAALKVKYTTGGSTPGDSYVWLVDSTFVPKSYRMYVPSMKMVDVPATWDEWTTTTSGTLLPKSHTFSSGRSLSMGDVKGYNE